MQLTTTEIASSVRTCLQTAMKLQEEHKQASTGDKRAEQKLENTYKRLVQDLGSLRTAIGSIKSESVMKELGHLQPLIEKIENCMNPLEVPSKRGKEKMMEIVVATLFGRELSDFVNHLYTLHEDAFRVKKVEAISETSSGKSN